MKMKRIRQLLCILAILFLSVASVAAQNKNVAVNISGIRSDKGQIVISVFTDNKSFSDEKPVSKIAFAKAGLVQGNLQIRLSLKPGTYGFAVIDDENKSNKLERNMLGIPKEGFGFSGFYLSGMSRPSFDDFKFEVKETPVTLPSKLRYM